jgi:glycyl-tRNA synthetase beta chain
MSTTADFLVELGTEELPPKALLTLRDAFCKGVEKRLAAANLSHAEVLSYATPRRLALIVPQLSLSQPSQTVENKGPPVSLAYDDDGQPSKAAQAFAKKCGVEISALDTLKTDKGEWLFYTGEVEGKATAELLGPIVNESLAALPIPRRMRWGDSDVEFVRPVHWLVMLLGNDVVAATVLGLTAGRKTFGHRFHAPEAISLNCPADYVDTLRKQGKVIADFAERRSVITAAANDAAQSIGGTAILSDKVVDEVTALVEWPVPVQGQFDKIFLRLPQEVLISTLQDHQRYFPVQGDDDLLPAFITISNLQSSAPDRVRAGNERVVLPRLSDAAFFWDQDVKQTLADRMAALDAVVYQRGLGSLHDKTERVAKLAAAIAPLTGADSATADRAARLARTDLLTDMVGEFPELQGRMGYYYALNDGEAEAVAQAIEEQYLPRHAGDRLPATTAGKTLSLADRLDTLAGIFCLGKKPSGNKDPFSLRRQALGIVRILIESGVDLDLRSLLEQAVAAQPVQTEGVAELLYEFILDRMRAWYLDGQSPDFAKGDISAEMFESVRSRAPASPLDFHQRLSAVQRFMALDSAVSLAAANKRIANILKKAKDTSSPAINAALFDAQEEKQLHAAVAALLPDHQTDLANRDYENVLKRLVELREPVDGYFDQVMVMTENEQLRANRLAQLGQLRELFLDVADISFIQTS